MLMDDQIEMEKLRLIARFPRLDRLVTRYLQGDQKFIEEEDKFAEPKQGTSGSKYQRKYYDD